VNSMFRRASIAKQQGDVALRAHVGNVCFKCFICFKGMLQVFHMDVVKVDRDVAYAASVSEAYCKGSFRLFHYFHTYVTSVVIWMLHMLQVYVLNVFICFSVLFKCFMFQRYIHRVMRARHGRSGKGRGESGADKWGARPAWGPTNGACSSLSRLPGPTLAERGEGHGEGMAGAAGVRVRGGVRQTGAGYACGTGLGRRGTYRRACAAAIWHSGRRSQSG
jgi:hypothetical protein